MRKLLTIAALGCGLATAMMAASPQAMAKDAAKPIEVTVCPMEMEAVHGEGGGQETFGQYHVHFCCGGCKPEFDKLSKEQKTAKIKAALKKQNTH